MFVRNWVWLDAVAIVSLSAALAPGGYQVTARATALGVLASSSQAVQLPTISPSVSAAALPSVLATPIAPLPTPSLPLPTPTLPIGAASPSPSPIVPSPSAIASPSPAQGATGAGSVGDDGTGGSASNDGGPSGDSPPRISVPFTTIVLRSPLDIALAVSLAVLPLLGGIWLLLFGRTWSRARRLKDGGVRLALAGDLGLTPRQLDSLSTRDLFKLREQTAFDELTGALRRAAGIVATEREIARSRRQKTPLAVAFVDVDGLKQTNDTRGHAAGDKLLRSLATVLKTGLRGQDLVFRYGGDEFVCVLPETGEQAARAKLAEIQTQTADSGTHFCVGVAELQRSDDVVSLLGRADHELYQLKGRRRAVMQLPRRPGSGRSGDRPVVA